MTKPKATGTARLYADGEEISLGPAVGAGREGSVHPVTGKPKLAAKLIGTQNPNPDETRVKLKLMVGSPPPRTTTREYLIAWPTTLVTIGRSKGTTAGYLMTMLDPTVYRQIGSYFNPARRRTLGKRRGRGYTYLNLLAMARNLAAAVAHLHDHGAVLGDINSRNVLANDRGRIAIIDTDSFQVTNPATGDTSRCLVGTPEYTPPRMQGMEFSSLDRTRDDDLFALAVMLYQLLIQGAHPYAGTQSEKAGPDAANIASRIAQGRFAHEAGEQHGPAATLNNTIIWNDLPLKKHFKTAFQSSKPRTSARTWARAITHAANGARKCASNPLHWHFTRRCTWCQYRVKTSLEPFPTPDGERPPPRHQPATIRKTAARTRRTHQNQHPALQGT